MASIDLIKASNGSGPAMQAVLTSSRVIGSNNLVVNNTINYPDKFIAELGTIDPVTNQIDPNTIQIVKVSRVDATNLVIDEFAQGYSDLGNSAGDVVLIRPTTEWANNIASVLAKSLKDDGSLAQIDKNEPGLKIAVQVDQPAPDPDGNIILWFEPQE